MTHTVGIVTDTVACLSRETLGRLGIGVVPVHVLVDGDDHLDGEIDQRELHDRIADGAEVSTATPSPGEFLAEYRRMAGEGFDSLVALTVSSPLSNVHNSARLAAAPSPIPTLVIDTRTVASAQGLIVRRMAEMAREGASARELAETFPDIRKRTGLIATVPDLASLSRTGRVPRVVGTIGGSLDLRPLIEIGDDGEAHAAGVTRSMSRASDRMVDRAVAALGSGTSRAVVMHTLAADAAQALAEELRGRAPGAEVEIAPFTAVMGIHTGPGLLGIAWESPGSER